MLITAGTADNADYHSAVHSRLVWFYPGSGRRYPTNRYRTFTKAHSLHDAEVRLYEAS